MQSNPYHIRHEYIERERGGELKALLTMRRVVMPVYTITTDIAVHKGTHNTTVDFSSTTSIPPSQVLPD